MVDVMENPNLTWMMTGGSNPMAQKTKNVLNMKYWLVTIGIPRSWIINPPALRRRRVLGRWFSFFTMIICTASLRIEVRTARLFESSDRRSERLIAQ